jgi:WXG100 family type VII secretion target
MSNLGQSVGGGSGSWEGMNPDVVEAQARILSGLSEEITALMNKIEGEVTQLSEEWHGDDSRKFAAEWAGTHKPVFTTASALLANMSDTSQRSASQQRATSSS